MRKILVCEPCGCEITNVFPIIKNVTYRRDLMITPDCVNHLVEYNREYFSGYVSDLIYNCKNCGEVIITSEDSNYLDDFIKVWYIELSKPRYGNLIVKDIPSYK